MNYTILTRNDTIDVSKPNPFSLDALTGVLTAPSIVYDPTHPELYTYIFVVQVMDAGGLTATPTITVTVSSANLTPKLNNAVVSVNENVGQVCATYDRGGTECACVVVCFTCALSHCRNTRTHLPTLTRNHRR